MAQSSQPLHEAIWKNDENSFKSCLEKGEDLNAEDEKRFKPLHIAVMTNNEKFVENLLSDKARKVEIDSRAWCYLTAIRNENIVKHFLNYNRGASIRHLTDDNGLTPLHHAVINRNQKLINAFCDLEYGITLVNTPAKNGFRPLHYATIANDLQIIDILLVKRCYVDIKTMDGSTALHLAVRNGHAESASLLLAMGSDVNKTVDSTGSSALHIAVENNDEKMIELLLQNDANVMCSDRNGKNLLHVAAEYGYDKWITFFIEKGIDVNGVTNDNSTPLLLALKNNKPDIVPILLKHKVDVNIRNNDGLSPLCAALEYNNIKLGKKLVTLKADVNNLTLEHSSVLHFAVKYCNNKMITYLLQHGAKLGVRNYLGQSELHIAAQRPENSDMLEHLLRLGMSVNELTFDKSTALHCAVSSEKLSRNNVEVLIRNNINIDTENVSGDTALNIICRSSCEKERYNIIEQLLIARANPNHIGSDKQMPLYSCIEKSHICTGYLLAKHGACCNRVSFHGDSVLHLLIKFKCGCPCTRMGYINHFISLGADVNHANEDGETPIHTSLMKTRYECLTEIKNLLEQGAHLTKNKYRENVLHMAIKYLGNDSNIEDIVNFFLEKNVNLYDHTENSSNIIHYAAQYCPNADVMKILLNKTRHCLINERDKEEKTPLHLAVTSGANSVVEVLLEHDANVNIVDKNGDSAINYAINGNHVETVKLLLKKGASKTIKNKNGFNPYDLAEQKNRHIYQLLLNH